MGVRVIKLKKKLLWGSAIVFGAVLAATGSALYLLTRPLEIEFSQEPNAVEAHEANRKLKLLNDAQTSQKRGFVRLSEVEINSFLDGRYNTGKNNQTNNAVRLVKAGVLLGSENVTFVTWHDAPILGIDLPFVWQRVVTPSKGTNGWNFNLQSMRVGQLDIPAQYWTYVQELFGRGDTLFEERKAWLQSLPLVTITRNEQSKSPEFRLYSYVPTEKVSGESPSERNAFPKN